MYICREQLKTTTMIIVHKIMHYTEFLEKSRNPDFSKLEVKVHSNKTLNNSEVVSCKMYLNLYPDTRQFGTIESTIKGRLIQVSKDKDLPVKEKEIAGGFLAYFTTGIMTYLPIRTWQQIIEFEKRNEVNFQIPNLIKSFVKEYYTLEVKTQQL